VPPVITPPTYWPFPVIPYPSQYRSYTELPYSSSPNQIANNFLASQERLRLVYDNTSMTASEYSAVERGLVSQAVSQLMTNTTGYSLSYREEALRSIYNHSEMTSYELHTIEQDMRNQTYGETYSAW
jgi:hypothetical protein